MLTFDNISFGYEKDQYLLRQLNFTINRGEFAAIVGGNGAGKTTSVKLMNGLLKASYGTVLLEDKNVAKMKTSDLAGKIGFLFQNPDRQICKNTVYDELLFGLECVYGKQAGHEKRVKEIIREFGFSAESDPFSLSRGERQRLALASVLAIQPDILILDEPTTGLDYQECMHIMGIVRQMNSRGTTVIMVSHDMELVADFADRVLIMEHGQIAADGPCAEILTDTALLEKTSVLPPQIACLGNLLGESFAGILDPDIMADEITRTAREREGIA